MAWLENVPIGSKIDIYLFERVEGQDAAFCHGKATIKPWQSQGVEGSQDLRRTYASRVDLVAYTKVADDRGPIIKLTVAINDHTSDVKVSGGPSADQAFMGYTWGSDPCQGVKVSGVEVSGAGASETCCFHVDPVMMKSQANLWNNTLSGSTLPDGLPWSPLRSYNILAMGLEWDKMEYHDSALGHASRRKSSSRIGLCK